MAVTGEEAGAFGGGKLGRVKVDGKHFAVDDERFRFRGVTYGTFAARADGALFPERDVVKQDLLAMESAGFTVVRTYTPPPDDVIEVAADWGLHLLAGVFFPDWRYLIGTSKRDRRRVAREAKAAVRAAARRFAGVENVLGLSVGNEVPADVVRWEGARAITGLIEELVECVREEDEQLLVTYANYPTAEYLQVEGLDFVTFNVFLEEQAGFHKYLSRLHNLAGERPLVLGEIGLNAGASSQGEKEQAHVVSWLMETALERGVAGTCLFSWTDEWWVGGRPVDGWHFGLTRADRSPRPALASAARWNGRTVPDLKKKWPSISVVICAYNASETLEECLSKTCALDYPNLEIIVVDDGSADETAEIARRFPRARLLRIDHAGLSGARNEGLRAARGEIVAYLDADAYPTPEWPYYLVLGLDAPNVVAVGGPNVPPLNQNGSARRVAQAPGGPVHVLLGDDRAEHLPGCNMAFRRRALAQVGAFDPVYTSAGDDVDLCWRILDEGWEIGFHPAALVWHHRRAGMRAYLKQQAGYGRAEALVEARHPDRFTALGTARWVGRIYNPVLPGVGGQRIYRGLYGTAAFQSVYRARSHIIDVVHQVGVPLSLLLLLTVPLALIHPLLALPAMIGLFSVSAMALADAAIARPPGRRGAWRFRLGVAALCLAQPLARSWGRLRHRMPARRDLPPLTALPRPARRVSRAVSLVPHDRPRADVAAALVSALRRARVRVLPATGWEDHDGALLGSTLIIGELVTSAHPPGCIQVRVRRRPRVARLLVLALAGVAAWTFGGGAALAAVLSVGAVEVARGLWRTGPLVHDVVARSAELRENAS